MRILRHALAATLVAFTGAVPAADYMPGQIWSMKGRAKDPEPQVLVLMVEPGTPVGDVVFVAVAGVKLCLPNGNCGDMFSPIAIKKEALDRSVKDFITIAPPPNDEERARFQFDKGYAFWKEGVAKGARVTVEVPLADALDEMEGGAKIQVK